MIANGKPLMAGLLLAGMGIALLAQTPERVPPAVETPEKTPAAAAKSPNNSEVDPFKPDVPIQVQVQVEFIDMSHEALTKLLFMAKPGTANATKLRQQVQDMVAKNEAKVLETQVLTGRSGAKATAEAIHEFISPTEYAAHLDPTKIKDGERIPSGYPTSFETRNLGSTIEIEPTITEKDESIDLRFNPELVWHTGNTIWHEGKDIAGNPFKNEMPNIYVLRLNTQLICKDGQYLLAGTVSPKDSKGEIDLTRKVMIFVKCDILTVR